MRAVEAMALVAGHVDEELLKRNEYLAAENEILRSKIKGRLHLNDGERIRLAADSPHKNSLHLTNGYKHNAAPRAETGLIGGLPGVAKTIQAATAAQ